MQKVCTVFILICILIAQKTNAQAFQYSSNPSPSWCIMDSGIAEIAAFSDTLLKGTRSLYLPQSIDSSGKLSTYTFHYVNGNGDILNFIYTYTKHNGSKVVSFIEVDGRKDDVMNIFNRYFHTTHEWDKERENGNVREFVYSQKTYILKMSENKDADGNPLGTVRSGIMSYQ